jgi:hypothetical protein
VQVFDDIEQGSPEWHLIRAGMPTASMFQDVIRKPGARGGIPKTRTTYLYKLAGEIITGVPMDTYSNHHMERGKAREEEARNFYAMIKNVEPEQIGFIKADNCGASPDSLVGDEGLLEIKDALPHIQIERLLAGTLPKEHEPQVQGQLMCSQRRWCDFMSHCRGMPPLIVRVPRNEAYIAALRIDVNTFVKELNQLVEKIRKM